MNRERLKYYLIGGALMTLLRQAQGRTFKAWIIQEPEGCTRIGYNAPSQAYDHIAGGEDIPMDLLRDGKLDNDSKDAVLAYLQKSFGLSRKQAKDVFFKVIAKQRLSRPDNSPVPTARLRWPLPRTGLTNLTGLLDAHAQR